MITFIIAFTSPQKTIGFNKTWQQYSDYYQQTPNKFPPPFRSILVTNKSHISHQPKPGQDNQKVCFSARKQASHVSTDMKSRSSRGKKIIHHNTGQNKN